MRIIAIVFISLMLASNAGGQDVFFSPSSDCEKNIINDIYESNKSIYAVIYSINNKNIMNALIDAKNRGVEVKILTDKLQASGKYSGVKFLYENGINIKIHTKHKIEHNKFAVFDDKKIITGSYNWTMAASDKNSENCIFLDDDEIVSKFKNRFFYLWQINDDEKSENWLKIRFQK